VRRLTAHPPPLRPTAVHRAVSTQHSVALPHTQTRTTEPAQSQHREHDRSLSGVLAASSVASSTRYASTRHATSLWSARRRLMSMLESFTREARRPRGGGGVGAREIPKHHGEKEHTETLAQPRGRHGRCFCGRASMDGCTRPDSWRPAAWSRCLMAATRRDNSSSRSSPSSPPPSLPPGSLARRTGATGPCTLAGGVVRSVQSSRSSCTLKNRY